MIKESVLFFVERLPKKDGQGDQIVSYNRLMYLYKYYNIILYVRSSSFVESDINEISPYCISIYFDRKLFPNSYLYSIFLTIFFIPIQCSRTFSFLTLFRLNKIIKKEKICLVHFYMLRLSIYSYFLKVPKIIDLNDSMTLNFSRRYATEKNSLIKFVLGIEIFFLKRFEKKIIDNFNYGYLVSIFDLNFFENINIEVLPLGINRNVINKKCQEKTNKIIAFTGNMFYYPNIEAVIWFVNNCWNQVLIEYPDAQFWIIGRNPNKAILNLHNKTNIKVMANVFSITEILLNEVMISIAPMKSGSGMQFKILEAFSAGVPIICSTLGLGDIKALNFKDVLISDHPLEFLKSIKLLFDSNETREKISQSAIELIENRYSWDAINNVVKNRYEQILLS